ncbi:MAG: hypothetical protein AAGN66_02275 [Acidobacteriota bacterium]
MNRMAKGEGKLGCIIYVLLTFAIGFSAYKFVPLQVAKMELTDYMKEIALHNPRKKADWFERRIKDRAEDLGLPVERKNIKVKKGKRIVIDVNYTVIVDLLITDYAWNVKIHMDREIFLT